ncbi:MAG: outer membrane protein assembly factor BamC [Pseudomonadota bacterium]
MKMIRTVACFVAYLAALPILTACSVFYTDDRPEVQYQRAYSAEELEVPPDLSTPYKSAGFVVEGELNGKIGRNTLLPRIDDVRYVRQGDISWLELSVPAAELWTMVKKFLEREGYLLQKDEPLQGFMQTTWAEEQLAVPRQGLAGLIDKTLELIRPNSSLTAYFFRFERENESATRLFVDHRTLEESRIDNDNRREDGEYAVLEAERDPEVESRMLVRLMVYLGIEVQRAKCIIDDD